MLKTQPLDEYREQRRGGQGKAAASVKEEDLIQNLYVLSSHVQILCFTTKGKYSGLKYTKFQLHREHLKVDL